MQGGKPPQARRGNDDAVWFIKLVFWTFVVGMGIVAFILLTGIIVR